MAEIRKIFAVIYCVFVHGEVLLSRTSKGERRSPGSSAPTRSRLQVSCANTQIDAELCEYLEEPGHSRQEYVAIGNAFITYSAPRK